MALKIKRAGEAEYGHYIKAMVAGDPGSGKTRTASTWPNVLYANVEGGLMSVADRNPAYVDIATTPDLKELRLALKQNPKVRESTFGIPVDTVIVDTFDEIAKMFMTERQAATGHEFQRDDWGWLGDELRGVLRGFRNLDLHVVINVHLKTSEDQQSGQTIQKAAIQGAVGDEIAAYFDLALLLRSRVITVPDPADPKKVIRQIARYYQTYSDLQHPWIKDRSGQLPSEMPVNFDDDFARMHQLIYSVIPQGSEDIVTLSTPAPLPVTPPPAKATAKKAAATKKAAAAPPQPTLPEAAQEPAPAPTPEPTSEPSPPATSDAPTDASPPQTAETPAEAPVQPPHTTEGDTGADQALGPDEANSFGEAIPAAEPIADPDAVHEISPVAQGMAEDLTADEDGRITIDLEAEAIAAAQAAAAAPPEPEDDGPGLEAPPALSEVPVDIPAGKFHSDTCPRGQALCDFDDEITPMSTVRFDKGALCRLCFLDEKREQTAAAT